MNLKHKNSSHEELFQKKNTKLNQKCKLSDIYAHNTRICMQKKV